MRNQTDIPKRYRIHKRSQLEAFGLAVIVVLLTLGLFIYVSLKRSAPKTTELKDFNCEDISQNFVNTIVLVTVRECYTNSYQFTVADLMRYCSNHENVTARCMGYEACPLLNKTMNEIVGKTLLKQDYSFRLYTKDLGWPQGGELVINNRNCTVNTPKCTPGWVPIVQSGTYQSISLNLDICKK
jgi:hypothetical protein